MGKFHADTVHPRPVDMTEEEICKAKPKGHIIGCSNLCDRLIDQKVNQVKKSGYTGRTSIYRLGFKRCKPCETYWQVKRINCPCCGRILRSTPRNRRRVPKRLEDRWKHAL